MKTIENIRQTYNYLQSVYDLSKNGNIKTDIKSESHKGHDVKSLLKHDILTEDNGIYKWNSTKPDYRRAFQYYNAVRNKKKTYGSLLAIIRNPDKYSTRQLVEAIAIKGMQDDLNKDEKKSNESDDNPEAVNLLEVKQESTTFNNNELLDELNNILSKITVSEEKNRLVVDIMEAVLNNIEGNRESINSLGTSISTMVKIVKNNQTNLHDITVTQYHLLKELYHQLDELSNENPAYEKRKSIIGEVMLHMKKRMEVNNNL